MEDSVGLVVLRKVDLTEGGGGLGLRWRSSVAGFGAVGHEWRPSRGIKV